MFIYLICFFVSRFFLNVYLFILFILISNYAYNLCIICNNFIFMSYTEKVMYRAHWSICGRISMFLIFLLDIQASIRASKQRLWVRKDRRSYQSMRYQVTPTTSVKNLPIHTMTSGTARFYVPVTWNTPQKRSKYISTSISASTLSGLLPMSLSPQAPSPHKYPAQ